MGIPPTYLFRQINLVQVYFKYKKPQLQFYPKCQLFGTPFSLFFAIIQGPMFTKSCLWRYKAMQVSWQPLVNPSRFIKPPTRMLTKRGIEITCITKQCSKATKFAFEEKYPPLPVIRIQNDGYFECFLIWKGHWFRLEKILEFMETKAIPHSMSIIVFKTPKFAWWNIIHMDCFIRIAPIYFSPTKSPKKTLQ